MTGGVHLGPCRAGQLQNKVLPFGTFCDMATIEPNGSTAGRQHATYFGQLLCAGFERRLVNDRLAEIQLARFAMTHPVQIACAGGLGQCGQDLFKRILGLVEHHDLCRRWGVAQQSGQVIESRINKNKGGCGHSSAQSQRVVGFPSTLKGGAKTAIDTATTFIE